MNRAMELAKRRQQAEEEEDEEEDDVPNASIVAGKSTNVKKERGPKREVEDVEDE